MTVGPVLVLTCDPRELDRFWLNDYAPEVIRTETRRYPAIDTIVSALGEPAEILSVPIPLNCRDGFNEAYYGRPERLLDEGARLACSAWSFVEPSVVKRAIENLRRDLVEGAWDSEYGHLRTRTVFEGSLKLIVSRTIKAF